jgi:Carboxypeptidase regulatory-like domain/TonB dependent receptor-like, beta-barrel
MKRITAACLFVFMLLAGSVVYAQGVGTSGEINGTVTDPSGGVIPKVSIEANEVAKGLRFTTATDTAGQYRLTGLPPGIYNVTAKSTGFTTEVQKGLEVNVGGTANLDFHLKVASTAVQVEVTAEAPVVETERGSQANLVNQQYIEDLPIDRRDYLTFTLLLPGVSDSTRLADDQDFRVKQTPQSGLSFYGSNGRGNNVTVDGGETSNDTGGVRLTLSQDAVQEFQVNRSNYGADLGAANGASINIVSKSGTDDFHGTVFGFFRNDAMDARDPFAFSQALQPGQAFNPVAADVQGLPVKDTLQRYQFGGALGGPIRKGKTQFFVSFEGLRQDAQNAVPLLLGTDILRPTAAQDTIIGQLAAEPAATIVTCFPGTMLPAPTCAGALQAGLTVSQLTGLSAGQAAVNTFLVNQFESEGGLFNYNTRTYLVSARVDHHIDNSNQLTFTFHYGHDLEESPDVQSLTAYSAGSSTHTYDAVLQGAWFHQFSSRTQNEARVQWDYESFNVIPNEPGEVGIQIPGFINNLGTNIFLPNLTILRRYEFADNVTLIRGKHTIKFGGTELLRGNHTESDTFMPGRFVFGSLPGGLISPQLASTTINPLQAASFGLPQVFQQGFGDADYPAYSRPQTGLYLQDSWKMTSNFTLNYGVRYEIDNQFNPLATYYGDVSPRISFAWDPFKDHKTVVRAGYGIFYGPVDAVIPQVDLSLGVLNKNRTSVENHKNASSVPDQVNNVINGCGLGFPGFPIFPAAPGANSPCTRFISIYVDPLTPTGLPIEPANQVFGALFAQGLIQCTTPAPGNSACVTPASLGPVPVINPTGTGIFVSNSGQLSPLQVLFTSQPGYKPPYSQQASIGIEREITPGFSIGVSGIYTHTLRLPVAIDTNLLKAPMSTVTLANGRQYSYRNWNTSAVADPAAGFESSGAGAGGVYPCAVTLNGFGQPVSSCLVNTLIVQNNQYTDAASSLYEGLILDVKKRFSDHFTLFGNYTFSKGFDTSTDFNSDYGPQDPTNLGLDRALSEFDERHKVVIAGVFDSPWKQDILSGFELAPIFNYHSGLPFNLLAGGEVNGDNHTTNERPIGAGRDTGLGPDYIDFDMRLSWQHKVGEKATVKLTVEGFNIANRTNYASVNNEVNPLFGIVTPPLGTCPISGQCATGNTSFNVHGIKPNYTTVFPSTPLAFTSAFPKRQIQLGVRFIF